MLIFFFLKNTFLLFEVFQVSDLSVCRRWRPYRSVSRLQDPVPVFDTGFAWDVVPAEKSTEAAATGWTCVSPPHPGPNWDPDIKGRWSETMKLQVRCQLPFETKHSPNPGKTWLVPGIRTNKEEPKAEWTRRGKGRVSRLRWQSSIRIKDPNSPSNYPAVLLGSPVGGVRGLSAGKKWEKQSWSCFYQESFRLEIGFHGNIKSALFYLVAKNEGVK